MFGLCHPGYDYEFTKLGHTMWSVDSLVWHRAKCRPWPKNLKSYVDHKGKFDLAVGGVGPDIPVMLKAECPLIINMINDGEGFYQDVEDLCKFICFLSDETSARWPLRDEKKRKVMGYGFDPVQYPECTHEVDRVLAIGNGMKWRSQAKHMNPREYEKEGPPKPPDKDADLLEYLNSEIPVDLYGIGNENMPVLNRGMVPGPRPFHDEARRYKVFVNPSRIINMVTLEAMAMKIPVVMYPTINHRDIARNGETVIFVETHEEAMAVARNMIKNDDLRHRLGEQASKEVYARYDFERWVDSWNKLFEQAIA